MTTTWRAMGDAIHDNVHILAGLRLELVAGYVTGSSDVRWTVPDWARFPGIPHVSIDQGFTGSPVANAIVRDVEAGAWTPGNAVHGRPWTPSRPTIYSAQNTLQAILDNGWRRDLWVALPGWQPGQPWPPVVAEAVKLGCTVVAVQNYMNVADAYDLSVVLDPYWPDVKPSEVSMFIEIPGVPGRWLNYSTHYDAPTKTAVIVGQGTDGRVFLTKSINGGVWSAPTAVT